MSLHLSGGRGKGQDRPIGIEQIDLDAGVDHHEHVENLFERPLIHSSRLDQDLFRNHVLGQGAVELLIHLLEVQPSGVKSQNDGQGADQTEQPEQDNGQFPIQSFEHWTTRLPALQKNYSRPPRPSKYTEGARDRFRSWPSAG